MLSYLTALNQKFRKFSGENQNGFQRNHSTTSQILTIHQILKGVRAKNLEATLLFVDFFKAFDSIHRGKMEQIPLAYGPSKETIAAIMMLYKNMKVKVRSLNGDRDFFDIVAVVLEGDTLAPYLFMICILITSTDLMKENGFILKKAKSRQYPIQTITDTNYADDIVLLANTPTQAESLLHNQEQAAGCIGLHVNIDKTEYMCFNQKRFITMLNGGLLNKFNYLGSSISSTENDINKRLAKAWTAINRLLIIWKLNLSDKIKCNFFQATVVSIILNGCTTWMLTEYREKDRWELHKNATSHIEQIFEATSHKAVAVRPPTSHLENHPNKTDKTCGILLEK